LHLSFAGKQETLHTRDHGGNLLLPLMADHLLPSGLIGQPVKMIIQPLSRITLYIQYVHIVLVARG
jgi:hypothetical protein